MFLLLLLEFNLHFLIVWLHFYNIEISQTFLIFGYKNVKLNFGKMLHKWSTSCDLFIYRLWIVAIYLLYECYDYITLKSCQNVSGNQWTLTCINALLLLLRTNIIRITIYTHIDFRSWFLFSSFWFPVIILQHNNNNYRIHCTGIHLYPVRTAGGSSIYLISIQILCEYTTEIIRVEHSALTIF